MINLISEHSSHYILWYLAVSVVFILINAFVVGLKGESTLGKDNYVDSVLWPITVMILIGMLVSLLVQKVFQKHKGKK